VTPLPLPLEVEMHTPEDVHLAVPTVQAPAAHTPGPWGISTVPTSIGTCHKIGPFPSLGNNGQTYACVYADNVRERDYGYTKVGDELLANARLIAAAPELLAACEKAVEWLDGWASAEPYIDTLLAAIEKATGAMNTSAKL
jgi:hypothetical protein